ncbi:MAG: hypothetical protein GY924_25375, partial [Planctomycetaceae bacterium]|nr:hypothetical protein [Planctomycetaceae bacterium]
KVALQIVIESPRVPGNRIVARATLIIEVAAVWVIVLMARDTFRIRVAERLRRVTVFAFILSVNTEQREWAQVMIEEHRILPVYFCVAALTLRTERTFVCVVIEMT